MRGEHGVGAPVPSGSALSAASGHLGHKATPPPPQRRRTRQPGGVTSKEARGESDSRAER